MLSQSTSSSGEGSGKLKPSASAVSSLNGHSDMENELSVEITSISEDDLDLFEHQISGHGSAEKGLLKHKSGHILKPLQKPPMGLREIRFYKTIFNSDPETIPSCYKELREFIPKFYGVVRLHRNQNVDNTELSATGDPVEYLLLQDILHGLTKPRVMDVKLGAQTWSPDASEAKIQQEKSKYTGTKVPLGICLTGMQYYEDIAEGESGTGKKSEKIKFGREKSKYLNPDSLKDVLKLFFNAQDKTKSVLVLNEIVTKLKRIEKVFSVQETFKLYGSSVLIAYDNELNPDAEGCLPIRVFIIDFAHFHDEKSSSVGLDENYLFGLRNLIRIFCEIAAEVKEERQ